MAMEMALRATAAVRPTLPPAATSPISSPSLSKLIPKSHCRPTSVSLPTSITLSLVGLLSPPDEAKALSLPKEQIVSSLSEVEKTIDQVQDLGSNVLDFTQRTFQAVGDAVKPGIDAAVPVIRSAGEEAVKIASPLMSEASKKAQETIQSTGFDTEPVLNAAKMVADTAQQTTKVIEDAKPIASSTVETISSADPIVIVGTAGALFLTYLLLPPIWSAISFSVRGYKGQLTPAQTLDLMTTNNHIMIDIRSEKDKDKAGIPRLPSDATNRMVAIPLEELPSKLKSLVRNTKKVEAEMAALKISYLKNINKASNLVIMDSYTDSAKTVARTLTSLGFKNCWIMAGGFSGGRGWLQSRLGTETYNLSFPEVLSPLQVMSEAGRRLGTSTGTVLQTTRKFLPN